MTLIIVIVVIVLLIAIYAGLYNSLIQLRTHAQESWSQIDVQLKRRFDLIPNLIETVKGYASHEKEIFGDADGIRDGFGLSSLRQQFPARGGQRRW